MALWLECWRSVPADSGQLCYLVLVRIAVDSPMSHCANNQFANVLDQFTNVLYVSLLMDYVRRQLLVSVHLHFIEVKIFELTFESQAVDLRCLALTLPVSTQKFVLVCYSEKF